jgi:folate-dependent phosphoribosylglycinamide formyltransferase PurN
MYRIVLLGSLRDPAKDMVYNAINPLFEIHKVLLEKPVSRKQMLRKRIRKMGLLRVLGQIAFQLLVVKTLGVFSRSRVKEIKHEFGLDTSPIPVEKIKVFNTINDDACIEILRELKPDLILVKGTRILSRKVLSAVDVPFINMHVGITPLYRGVHGAYWALTNNDRVNAGTTIHYVDAGIDTGRIIAQRTINISPKDNFYTYPLIQIAAGIELLKACLPALTKSQRVAWEPIPVGESRLWSHPTIWFYLKNRIINGIK